MRVDELNYKDGNFENENDNEMLTEYEMGEDVGAGYSEGTYVANKEARKQKRNAKIKRRHNFLKIMLVLFCVVGVLLTPVFNIKTISVSGNSYLSKEQIIEASGILKNSNIFIFQTKKAVSDLENLSFVDVAKVKRTFPTGVQIHVKECVPTAQISCGQSLYLIVDKNGKILDTASKAEKYNLPCIKDINVSEFEVGGIVKTEDKKMFEKLLLLSREISENKMTENVESIYAKKTSMYVNLKRGIICDLGEGNNLSYRIKFIKEVYDSIPEEKTGKLEFVEEYKAVFTEDEK